MGGSGSSRWQRKHAKRTAECQNRIDIRWLKKHGNLIPGKIGTLSWTCGDDQNGSIAYRIERGRIVLSYRYWFPGSESESIEEPISFDRTQCNYGSHRLWFLCPRCRKRVTVLYGAGKYFLCRHCYNLTYSSQQESRADRLMRKARKIRKRMGGDGDMFKLFPDKPKNMHRKTYWRLREESERARKHWFLMAGRQMHSMTKKVNIIRNTYEIRPAALKETPDGNSQRNIPTHENHPF